MTERINPSLIKMANEMLKGHLDEALEAVDELQKDGFVPASAMKMAQGMGMPPGAPMPPQAPMPPGAPMPPAGPTPAVGPMPPGPAGVPPAPPDAAMMAGQPPMDPMAGGGMPAGQPIVVGLEDLMMLFSQIVEQQGAAKAEEDAMAGPNEGETSPTTNKQIGARIDALDEKLDMLLSMLGGGMAPGAEGGAPPMGEEIPPDLMAAMGAVPPADVAGGGMPPAAMGAAMPPEAVAGAPMPMIPGGMPVSASKGNGMQKASAMSISKLVTGLRRK